ncbi:hypothetical protein PORCRE_8 [Porphyromonas crevioricanis JCM 15906]|uniref:Uncharacterized protein n=1 Tax=Porphyromonas crevioricanis JCM 15906 TaxID=1305617 RepID=S4N8Z4_9PORP|nr:hypothetical protein PORCRE_8 [Porphyromonas crevioricanis JCM 15906]GAD08490.1 hypothetical protein PORCAN_2138 [Porphyromonas crevioricanis JCM 13913]
MHCYRFYMLASTQTVGAKIQTRAVIFVRSHPTKCDLVLACTAVHQIVAPDTVVIQVLYLKIRLGSAFSSKLSLPFLHTHPFRTNLIRKSRFIHFQVHKLPIHY